MTAMKMLLLSIICIASIFISAKASPLDQGTNLKLQFPRYLEGNVNYKVYTDINQSTLTENAYALVGFKELDGGSGPHSVARRHRSYTAVLTRFDTKGITSNKSCTVEFKPEKFDIVYDFLKYSLYNDKIVLAYLTVVNDAKQNKLVDAHQNYRIVHMETCKFYDAKVKLNFNERVVANNFKADIFYHDKNGIFDMYVDSAACDGGKCKYTFNDKAEQIGEPAAFLSTEYKKNVVKIFPSTKSSNHFVFVSNWNSAADNSGISLLAEFIGSQKLLYVKDGGINELTHFNFDYRKEKLLVKNAHGFLSFCRVYKVNNKNEINCMQFSDDVVKFNETMTLSDSDEVLGIYNLPTGGIILVKGNCKKSACKGMSFEKWSHDVKAQKLHSVEDFEYGTSLQRVIVNTDSDNELCVSIYIDNYKNYDFLKKCLPKNVFSLVH